MPTISPTEHTEFQRAGCLEKTATISMAHVTDGTSNTVAVVETLYWVATAIVRAGECVVG